MSQDQSSSARGVSVVIAAVGINLILGSLYAWSVLGKALAKELKWTSTDAALPFTVSTAAFALMMIFAGRWQDKMGPRMVALVGGIMFGGGLILSSFAHSPLLLAITYGVIGGMGIGLCYSATTPPSIKWFSPARKGLITGIVVSGVGLASVYVAPLTSYLLQGYGIDNTFLFLGSGALALIVLLSLVLTNPSAGYQASRQALAAAAAKAPAVARRDIDWREMLGTRHFYQIWLMFVLSASAGLLLISQIASIAKNQAHYEAGYVLVAGLAAFNTSGRFVSGFLSDRIGRPRTMVLAFVIAAANMFAFSYYTTPELLLFGSAVAGLCYGTIFTLMPAVTADFYGIRNLGVNYGFVFTAFGVAGTLGPIMAGRIYDAYKTYSYSYTISAIMLVAGAALALVTKAPKPAAAVAEQ